MVKIDCRVVFLTPPIFGRNLLTVSKRTKLEAQEATIAELKSTVAQQQKGMEALTAQVQKVSAQIAGK